MSPERQPVLIVALSGRALAQSARRAGWAPVVLDAFADLDTAEAAAAVERVPVDADWRLERDPLLAAADRLAPAPTPLVYGSGLERSPDLLARLAQGRELLGCPPEVLRAAKDPPTFAALLARLGLPHPAIRLEPPADPAGWLMKRPGGAGGGHVLPAGSQARPGCYWQRQVPGRAVSVLVAGDGADAVRLAMSEQWTDPTPGRPFRYGGAAAPASLTDAQETQLADAARRIAAACGLRGLGSVDALLDGEAGLHLLELNPRPGAALDAYERAWDQSLFALHVAACRGRLGTLGIPARAAAAALVRAPERVTIPPGFRWPTWTADRGPAGSVVAAGGPVCTVLGEGLTAAEARGVAETRSLTLLARLRRHAQRAG